MNIITPITTEMNNQRRLKPFFQLKFCQLILIRFTSLTGQLRPALLVTLWCSSLLFDLPHTVEPYRDIFNEGYNSEYHQLWGIDSTM